MFNLKNIFNANTVAGRANVAKATYASFAALYLFNRFRKRGQTESPNLKHQDEFHNTHLLKEHNGGSNGDHGDHGDHDEQKAECNCECKDCKARGKHAKHAHSQLEHSLDEPEPQLHQLVNAYTGFRDEEMEYHASPVGIDVFKHIEPMDESQPSPRSISAYMIDGDDTLESYGKPVENSVFKKTKIEEDSETNFEKILGPYMNMGSQHFEAYGDYDDHRMLKPIKDKEKSTLKPAKSLDEDLIYLSLDELFRPYLRGPRKPQQPNSLAERVEHEIFEKNKSKEPKSNIDKYLDAYIDKDDPTK